MPETPSQVAPEDSMDEQSHVIPMSDWAREAIAQQDAHNAALLQQEQAKLEETEAKIAEAHKFELMTDEQQSNEVTRALAVLEAAELSEIKLSAVDVAEVLGYEDAGRFSKIWDTAKEHLPGLKSRRERFSTAIENLHEQANWENAERDQQTVVENWAQTATEMHLVTKGAGIDMMLPLQLTDGGGRSFELGRMMELPASIRNQLSPEEQQFLQDRQAFWRELKVEFGPAADHFIEAHIDQLEINLVGKLPSEIDWLLAAHPEARTLIEQLQAGGNKINLQKLTETPDTVLDAIRHVAVQSQHKFVSTWLPQLILEDQRPRILESDRRSVSEGYQQLQSANQRFTSAGGFRRELVTRLFGQRKADDLDFDGSVKLIQTFARDVLSLNVEGEISTEQRDLLAQLNAVMADGLGREYARRRLIGDDAARNSEGAQKIIKSLAVLGPTVEVVENTFHLGGIAKFIAASGDDIASEVAELSALKGAGMTHEELMQRLKILGPAAVVAMASASMIDRVEKTVSPRLAGVLFSSSAVLLSAVTGALSIKYFADNYAELAAEGKVDGLFPVDQRFSDQLNRLDSQSVSSDEIIVTVEEALEASGSEGDEHEEVMSQIRELIKTHSIEEIIEATKSPGLRQRYAAGLKEATAVNPARLGLTVGTYTSPIMGAIFGPIFLSNPLLYAVAGSYETISGAASIWMFNKTFDLRWNRYIDKHMPQ